MKDLGLTTANSNKRNWDFNPAFGGPILRDKLWFWATGRSQVGDVFVGGINFNLNANNPNVWSYAPDTSQPGFMTGLWWDTQVRLTWQANANNKIAASFDKQYSNQNFFGLTATVSPESAVSRHMPVQSFYHAEWTSPLTSRLLAEFVILDRRELWGNFTPPEGFDNAAVIPVVSQATGLRYHGGGGVQFGGAYNRSSNPNWIYRASLSYITGAHSVKFGYNDQQGYLDHYLYQFTPLAYRVNNETSATPNQLTEFAHPLAYKTDLDHDMGLFVQDRWTIQRATITYGLRFDWFKTSYPAQQAIPGLLFPNRNTQYAAGEFIDWKDVEPRFGLVYDLFGDGKTAARVTVNKYLAGLGLNGLATDGNPVNAVATSTTRSWTDGNGNYVADCNLLNPNLQNNLASGGDLCGAMTTPSFLTGTPLASFSNDLLTGWGHRGYNWEFTAGVQREIMPRLSVDVAYFRRVFGNFRITDNTQTAASDYTLLTVTAPLDARLPGGGGYPVTGIANVNQNKFGQVSNLNELDSELGANQIQHWNGVDITARARLFGGAQVAGGISMGRQTNDNCEVVALVPEVSPTTSQAFCHQDQIMQTQVKLSGSYTLPRIGVLASGTFQSVPGPQITANVVYTNAQIAAANGGRNLSGNTQALAINVVPPQTMYGERLNQLDLRFGKMVRFDRYRMTPSVDIFNALNRDTVLTQSNQFANWQRPQSILTARFVKFSVQLDF